MQTLGGTWLLVLMPVFFSLVAATLGRRSLKPFIWMASVAMAVFGIWSSFLPDTVSVLTNFDPLTRIFVFILSIVAPLVLVNAIKYMEKYASSYVGNFRNRFFVLMFLFISSMYGFVISNNMVLFFIFWEFMSVCSFMLISFDYKNPKAVAAANKCLILTQIGGLVVLSGLLLLSSSTQTFTISEALDRTIQVPAGLMMTIAVLLALGALSKSSIFPFNWLPDAMAAPAPVSALLHSATLVNAGIFIVMRFLPLMKEFAAVSIMIAAFSFISMFFSSLSALFEKEIKRILAFSTIANLSIILATLSLFSPEALAASSFQLLNHALFKSGLFMLAGVMMFYLDEHDLDKLKGAAHSMGKLKYGLLFLILAAAAIPPTNTFLSKWSIYTVWLNEFPLGLLLIAMTTMIAIVYYSKMINFLFHGTGKSVKISKEFWVSISPIVALSLLFGVTPLGYMIIAPLASVPAFSISFPLTLLLFSLVIGIAMSRSRINVDKTGPFTGGEDTMPDFPLADYFSGYENVLQKAANILNVDLAYLKIIKLRNAVDSLSKLDDYLNRKFVAWTFAAVLIMFALIYVIGV